MKIFYFVLAIIFLNPVAQSQTVMVAGECINNPTTLSSIGDIDGKPAYSGTGTVQGIPGVTIFVYWLGAPDNVWVLDFDGQPYFQNSCASAKPPGTGNSSCPWSAVSGMVCTGGTALSIGGSGVLPVNLTSFTATEINNMVVLNWQTASEINNRNFDIQRSKDGSNWMTLGSVNGANNSVTAVSYHFTDSIPLPRKNFYRLIQHDINGRSSYSRVISIDFSTSSYYTISGNPGNGIYNVNIQTLKPVSLWVSDLSGKRLQTTTAAPGLHRIDISRYPSGMYLLQIKTDTEILTKKLIKK